MQCVQLYTDKYEIKCTVPLGSQEVPVGKIELEMHEKEAGKERKGRFCSLNGRSEAGKREMKGALDCLGLDYAALLLGKAVVWIAGNSFCNKTSE